MDYAEYLAHIVRLSKGLDPARAGSDDARAGYLARLVQLAARLHVDDVTDDHVLADALAKLKPNMQDILWRVGGATWERRRALSDTSRRLLGALEGAPDLLGPIGQERSERAHSSALAFFLDPRQSGVIGAACLDAFVKLLVQQAPAEDQQDLPDQLDLRGASVVAERELGRWGRVDLSLDAPGALVFIEVKVDAGEGPEQLTRYGRALDDLASGRETLLVFLTLDDAPAGATGRAHRHITFTDVLGAWLPVAASQSGGEAAYLTMYLKTIALHLRRLAGVGEFDRWDLRTQRAALAFLERGVDA